MINLKYKNKQLEKIFNDEEEMKKYFKNDIMLVNGLKALVFLFGSEDSIYEFNKKDYLKGYNLEKITDSKYHSIRVVPKKDKKKERIILLIVSDDGRNVKIVEIDKDHRYRMKK